MRTVIAIGLVLVLALLGLKLATAPLNATYDVGDCERAYARAKSLADSARTDLHPLLTKPGGPRRYCGEVRARPLNSPSDLAARQPNTSP